MNAPTNHQIVMHNGTPVAVVVPYEEYLALVDNDRVDPADILTNEELQAVKDDKLTIPHDVVRLTVDKGMTMIRAWREHLGFTQDDVAQRMKSTQAAYARMESGKVKPRLSTLRRIAKAFGIDASQLDF